MRKILEEFMEFIDKGDVMDMAVGIIIGGAFTGIVSALTDDIINPLITVVTGGNGTEVGGLVVPGTRIDFGALISAIINFLIIAAVVFLLRKPFAGLYGSASDEQVFKLATMMIAIGAATLLGTSYHAACFVGINRGAGDSRFVTKVDMVCGWLVVLPLTFLAAFVFKWPLWAVFLMTRIDQCFKWIIAFFRLRGDKWIKNVTRDN